MKQFFIYFLLALLFNCSQNIVSGLLDETVTVNNSKFKILYGSDTLFVIQKTSNYPDPYYEYEKKIRVVSKEDIKIIDNKFFKLNGVEYEINFQSLNPDVITVNDNGQIRIVGIGNASIKIIIGNQVSIINLTVVEIPINKNMTKNQIINTIGVPDDTHEMLMDYFSNVTMDRILYTGQSFTSINNKIEHWIYHKYPNAIIRFYNDKLNDCVVPEWTYLTNN